MKYQVDIIPRVSGLKIPYSRELEAEIGEVVLNWIDKNVEYPGQWTTYLYAEDENGEPQGPSTRIN